MKIALIGASGFVGSAILKEALDRGHEVTAIALCANISGTLRLSSIRVAGGEEYPS